jgi:hypothetical protein
MRWMAIYVERREEIRKRLYVVHSVIKSLEIACKAIHFKRRKIDYAVYTRIDR